MPFMSEVVILKIHAAIYSFYNLIYDTVPISYNIHNVFFENRINYAFYHGTSPQPDAGDASISDSWFYQGIQAGKAGIYCTSGGGLKISNVKFNAQGYKAAGGPDISHPIVINPTGSTSGFINRQCINRNCLDNSHREI